VLSCDRKGAGAAPPVHGRWCRHGSTLCDERKPVGDFVRRSIRAAHFVAPIGLPFLPGLAALPARSWPRPGAGRPSRGARSERGPLLLRPAAHNRCPGTPARVDWSRLSLPGHVGDGPVGHDEFAPTARVDNPQTRAWCWEPATPVAVPGKAPVLGPARTVGQAVGGR
jgi:hypothetical protein